MPIILSEAAANQIKKIITDQGMPAEKTRLRVGVRGGGCSGFSYSLDLVEDEPAESDEEFESNGVKILCDMKSHIYLSGESARSRSPTSSITRSASVVKSSTAMRPSFPMCMRSAATDLR
jgi:iron-sulfur cluster assembly protein